MNKRYKVIRTKEPAGFTGDWEGPVWGAVEAIEIKNFMGIEPEHKPRTEAKVLYDDEFIYVIFRVEDNFVRAVAERNYDKVWEDSCVEFFFTPGEDISGGYFNFEMNCGGTFLFCHQSSRGRDVKRFSEEELGGIKIYHSEEKIVEPEKQKPTAWVVEYGVPIDILKKFSEVARPGSVVNWRANFYKCGDKTSKPHWLTWSVVDFPEPNFHLPEFFGWLEFE